MFGGWFPSFLCVVHVGLISVCWAVWLYLQFLSLQKAPLLHAQLIWMLPSSHSTIFIGAIMTVLRVESSWASVQLKQGTETGANSLSRLNLTIHAPFQTYYMLKK